MTVPPDIRYDTDLDHHSAQFREHNYAALDDLRDRCPVAKSSAWDGFWIFTAYDAVFEASRDPGLFSSHMDKAVPTLGQPDPMIPIDIDPPLLQQYRRLLLPFLSPKAAADREADLRQMAGAMIDGFIERGEADLSQELFTPRSRGSCGPARSVSTAACTTVPTPRTAATRPAASAARTGSKASSSTLRPRQSAT